MLKKLSAVLLALVLLAGFQPVIPHQRSALWAASATAEENPNLDIQLDENLWINSAAQQGDTLYLSAFEGLYWYKRGDQAATLLINLEALVDSEQLRPGFMLLNDESGALYGLQPDMEGLELYTLTVDTEALNHGDPLRLTYGDSLTVNHEYMEQPVNVLMHDGRLYTLYKIYGPQGGQSVLLSFDALAGGDARRHQVDNVQRIAAYKDGKLLALVFDEQDGYDQAAQQMKPTQLMVLDPAADQLEDLGSTGIPYADMGADLLYEAESDSIYLLNKDEVYRKVGDGPLEKAAYVAPGYGSVKPHGQMMLLAPGVLAVPGSQTLSIRKADPATLPAVRLHIYGAYMDSAMRQAITQMGDIPVTFLDAKFFPDAQSLGQALVSGEDNIDIYMLDTQSIEVGNLLKKGYAHDLSGSPVLTAFADSTYPFMGGIGSFDGKLLMVPVRSSAQVMGYYPDALQALGMELPETFADFCDFLQRWNDGLAEQHPDYVVTHEFSLQEALPMLALRLFANTAAGEGQPFNFADPRLKTMMQRAEQLRLDEISQEVDWSSTTIDKDMQEFYNKKPLFDQYGTLDMRVLHYSLSLAGRDTAEFRPPVPYLLKADENAKGYIAVSLTMAAVNPRSKNAEAAIQLLEAYVQNLEPVDKAQLVPGQDAAIPNPNYEEQMSSMDAYIKSMRQSVEKAEGAEKTELQSQLDSMLKSAEIERMTARFLASEEAVKMYRELMANAFAVTSEGANVVYSNPDMYSLLERYQQKQISLDQYLQEAEGKLRLMRLESE